MMLFHQQAELKKWSVHRDMHPAMPVKSRLLRCLSFEPFENGAHGRTRTCTGDALDVVSLLLDYAGFENGIEMKMIRRG